MKYSVLRFAAIASVVAGMGLARLAAVEYTTTASDLLGTVVPGNPAEEDNATEQVRFLVAAFNLGTAHGTNLGDNLADPDTGGPEVYTLYRPTGAVAPLPTPVQGADAVDGPSPVADVGAFGYQYILFFQASTAWVYWIGDIAPGTDIRWGGDNGFAPGKGGSTNGTVISHYQLFNPRSPGTPNPTGGGGVPDGGTTLMLTGMSLLLTALTFRHKKRA